MIELVNEIKSLFGKLSETEKKQLFAELQDSENKLLENNIFSKLRTEGLKNKIYCCPHCESKDFRKHGKDKESQRYYCKKCFQTFTEYTGTWLAHIHKKDLLQDYIQHITKEDSIKKITEELDITAPTALAWRHKIMSAVEEQQKGNFIGITESDEIFFAYSEKGTQSLTRKARRRGGEIKEKGIANEQIAVLTTMDRKTEKDLTVAKAGRIRKKDLTRILKKRVNNQTVLCSDAHVSFKGFAKDNKLEHYALKASIKEFVKDKVYHIQNINSLHSRLRLWLDGKFKGVSTKYLQKYLNWFRFKELFKRSKEFMNDLINITIHDNNAWKRYKQTEELLNQLTT